MIELDRLSYTYPNKSRPALAGISLGIEEGEFVLLAGPSGAGKSTLLRCLNGLVPHFSGGKVSGRIRVAGHDPVAEGPAALSRIVGFVFQDPEAQFVVDRVAAEIAFALENAAMPPAEMQERVEEALALLDLTKMRDRPLDSLSGGERQRVAIAAALALRPRILVLDEPTSQLDPQSAEDLLQALVRLNRDLGLTVILCEHRLERVLAHCDRMLTLSLDGGLEHDGPPQAVLPHIDLTPPLVTVGKALGWRPLPLTIQDGRRFACRMQAAPEPHRDAKARAVRRTGSDTLALSIANLSHAYDGVPALSGVALSVAQGEMVALMGRNGSGKSTLLNCVVGLLRPAGGDVRVAVAGRSVLGEETADICRRVGYLPQDPDALLFADTVRDELLVTLRNYGLRPENSPVPLSELLEVLGLDGEADAYPRDLSVGQRQRVALGAVTVTRPGLMLLDEPTRGQDYPAKRDLAALLRRWQAAGTGVLMATHDVELVAQAADRVVILSGGEVIADGQPAAVLGASPLFAPQVAQLFPDTGWLTAEEVLAAVINRA